MPHCSKGGRELFLFIFGKCTHFGGLPRTALVLFLLKSEHIARKLFFDCAGVKRAA